MIQPAFQLNREFLAKICDKLYTSKTRSAHEKRVISLFGQISQLPQETLAQIIDTAYWASLAIEEGHLVKFSVIIKDYQKSQNIFCFENPIPLNLKNLVKLGAALDGSFSDICVNRDADGTLRIWGLHMRSPNHLATDLWIQVLGPGYLLIICYGRSIAALNGNQAVFIDPANLFKAIIPKISSTTEEPARDSLRFLRFHTLLYIAQAMRAHQRGGTLLVIPDGDSWKRSIGQPVIYTGATSFLEPEFKGMPEISPRPSIQDLLKLLQEAATTQDHHLMKIRSQVIDQCNRIGRLTAIDGALVMTFDRSIRCFGAKIQAIDPQPGSTEVRLLRPVEGDRGSRMIFADLGGMRHSSAAQFAYDQPDSLAIVASQDGNVTFFTRDAAGDELLVVQQSEIALMYEGIGGVMWNLSQFIDDE